MSYFIKRDEKINGPFTKDQVFAQVKLRKLRGTDLVSKSQAGPWRTIEKALSASRKSASTSLPSEKVEVQELEVVADEPLKLQPLQEDVLPLQSAVDGSFVNSPSPYWIPVKSQIKQNINDQSTGRRINARTQEKVKAGDNGASLTNWQVRLAIIIGVGVFVILLVGGGILFGPSIHFQLEFGQVKKLHKQAIQEGERGLRFTNNGKAFDSMEDMKNSLAKKDKYLDRMKEIIKKIESITKDWTRDQKNKYEEWILDHSVP